MTTSATTRMLTAANPGLAPGRFIRAHRRGCTTAAVLLAYFVASTAASWPATPWDPSLIRTGDLDASAWAMAWTSFAITHGHTLFATTWLNYPDGVNLAQNNLSLLLGVLTLPLTLAVSPVASVNLLLWLGYPLSAASMFFVLRRFVTSDLAAFLGGALYGFSPYMVDEGLAHLCLQFAPLPPLIFYCAYVVIRPDPGRRLRCGAVLGLLMAAQFYIAPELLVTSTLMMGLGCVFVALAHRHDVVSAVRRAWRPFALAAGVALILCAYPIYVLTTGPYRYVNGATPDWIEGADVVSLLAPTPQFRLAPSGVAAHAVTLMGANSADQADYIGIPLLLLCALLLIRYWRRPWIRAAALMAAVSGLLSLGSQIWFNNDATGIPGPAALFQFVPFLKQTLPERLSLYTDMFLAGIVALGLDSLMARSSTTYGEARPRSLFRWRPAGLGFLRSFRFWIATLTILTVASLIPSWPFTPGGTGVPPYFTSSATDRIKPGSVALLWPYPGSVPELFQAEAAMRFRIIGGYLLFRNNMPVPGEPNGSQTVMPAVLRPSAVERFLYSPPSAPGGVYPAGTVPALNHRLVCETRSYLTRYDVSSVIVANIGANPASVHTLFTRALGRAAQTTGGVTAWYDVPQLMSADSRGC